WLGRRTLRLVDLGKVAVTFADTHTGQAIRLSPAAGVRERAVAYAPDARTPWHAQLQAYRVMPAGDLLHVEAVRLATPLSATVGQPGLRVPCSVCGEEVMNRREVRLLSGVRCRSCAGERYYEPIASGESAQPEGALRTGR